MALFALGERPDYLKIRRYIADIDPRPVLDWLEAIRRQAVVYVGLDALTGPEVAEVVGESAFSELWKIRIPLPSPADEQALPDELGAMLAAMRAEYTTVTDWPSYKRAFGAAADQAG